MLSFHTSDYSSGKTKAGRAGKTGLKLGENVTSQLLWNVTEGVENTAKRPLEPGSADI